MKHILVVGAGGIGSHLARFLHVLDGAKQLQNTSITFADDDIVEKKNTLYQNFTTVDIMDYKVQSIASRYGFNAITERITDMVKLDRYSCVVCAVDNKSFRTSLFEYMELHDNTYWIDLRSEGRAFAYYTKNKENTLEVMMATLPQGDAEAGSCQLKYELDNGIVQQGNVIVAAIGSQLILNWLREDYNAPKGGTMV